MEGAIIMLKKFLQLMLQQEDENNFIQLLRTFLNNELNIELSELEILKIFIEKKACPKNEQHITGDEQNTFNKLCDLSAAENSSELADLSKKCHDMLQTTLDEHRENRKILKNYPDNSEIKLLEDEVEKLHNLNKILDQLYLYLKEEQATHERQIFLSEPSALKVEEEEESERACCCCGFF